MKKNQVVKRVAAGGCSLLLLAFLAGSGCSVAPSAGCSKDQDCKDSRICRDGRCVDVGGEVDASSPADTGTSTDTGVATSEWETKWACLAILSPAPRKSLTTCSMCPAGFTCVQQRLTDYVYCVHPCTTSADCSCGGKPFKCGTTLLDAWPVVANVCLANGG